MWLATTSADAYIAGESVSGRTKPTSVLPPGGRDLDKLSDPQVRETDNLLNGILEELSHRKPVSYSILRELYLGASSNPALLDHWRRSHNHNECAKFQIYEGTLTWIVKKIGNKHLHVVDPYERGTKKEIINEQGDRNLGKCKEAFSEAMAELTHLPERKRRAEARRKAMKRSGYSRAQVYRITA